VGEWTRGGFLNVQKRTLADGRLVFTLYWDLPAGSGKRPREKRSLRNITQREAEAIWHRRQAEIDRGLAGMPSTTSKRETVAEYLAAWLGGKDILQSTRTSYADLIRLHMEPLLGHLPLADLRPGHVADWQAAVARKPGRDGDRLSPRRVAYARGILKQALDDAVRAGKLATNPVLVRPPRQVQRDPQALTLEQAQLFEAACGHVRTANLWRFLWRTGLRLGEALALRWEDVHIDAEPPRVDVNRSLTEDEDGRFREITRGKTPRAIRSLPLVPGAVDALRQQRLQLERERQRAGTKWTDGGWVFPTHRGGLMAERTAEDAIKRVCKIAGLPKWIGPHTLRHTFATLARAAGEDIVGLADALGHASIAFTGQRYSHATAASRRNTASRFASFIGEQVPKEADTKMPPDDQAASGDANSHNADDEQAGGT